MEALPENEISNMREWYLMLIFDSIGTILLITLIAEILRWKTGSVRKCFFG